MVEVLVPIAPDVWHLPADPLKLPGGVRMPLASTVLRLPDRSLLLYSPVALDDAKAEALSTLGEVAHIIAPSLLHHLWAKPAHERFPRATLHGAPGLAAKALGPRHPARARRSRPRVGRLDRCRRDRRCPSHQRRRPVPSSE